MSPGPGYNHIDSQKGLSRVSDPGYLFFAAQKLKRSAVPGDIYQILDVCEATQTNRRRSGAGGRGDELGLEYFVSLALKGRVIAIDAKRVRASGSVQRWAKALHREWFSV